MPEARWSSVKSIENGDVFALRYHNEVELPSSALCLTRRAVLYQGHAITRAVDQPVITANSACPGLHAGNLSMVTCEWVCAGLMDSGLGQGLPGLQNDVDHEGAVNLQKWSH